MYKGKFSSTTHAIIGAGHMGGAVLTGWLKSCETENLEFPLSPSQMLVVDPSPNVTVKKTLSLGVKFSQNLTKGAGSGLDVCLLAIKPQLFAKIGPDLADNLPRNCLVISIMAGIDIAGLEAVFDDRPIVRAMPNMPAAFGAGITAYIGSKNINTDHLKLAAARLAVCGKTLALSHEDQIDMVTALSGSGPAYVFHLCETMCEAGVKLGLPREMAMRLARQTLIGSGIVMDGLDKPVSELRQSVTSKGGTTAAALAVLMGEDGMGSVMQNAMQAAFDRAKELGKH